MCQMAASAPSGIKKSQGQQTIQRWREIIAAGHRFSEAQHRVALAVSVAKHAQQLLLDVVQTGAIGTEIEAVRTAGGAVWQALAQ